MAETVATLAAVFTANTSNFDRGLQSVTSGMEAAGRSFSSGLKSIGASTSRLGAGMTAFAAPLIAGLGYAAKSAIEFDETMTNTAAVLGVSRSEMEDLNREIIQIGMNSRAGPQEAAEAFYDIVGGVSDASTHMAILEAAIATAEAGSAELGATTSGLISVMNSYGFAADQAAFVSDVFTRTVGMGVGTMDEFVSAMGPISGIAAQTGVDFDEMGAAMAFMTTQGFSASQSATRVQSAITALLKPNAAMSEAFALMGVESGSAALEMYGLSGTLDLLSGALGGSTDEMSIALGSTEALGAAMALTQPGFEDFFDTFNGGLEGATDAAQQIQMTSPAAQLDLLKSSAEGLAIIIGSAFLPALNGIVEKVTPVVTAIANWAAENPELVQQVGMMILAVGGLGVVLMPLGGIISGLGSAMSVAKFAVTGLSGAFTFLISPIGLALAAGAALVAAYTTNFGGFRDFVDNEIRPRLEKFFNFLGDVWEWVQPGINNFKMGVEIAFNFIKDTVVPALQKGFQGFIDHAIKFWEFIQPGIEAFKGGVETAFNFIKNEIVPALQKGIQDFIDFVGKIWESISPGIESIKEGFNTAFTFIKDDVITPVKTSIDTFKGLVMGVWNAISGPIEDVKSGFDEKFGFITNDVIQPFSDAIDGISTAVQWVSETIEGPLNTIQGLFEGALGGISDIVSGISGAIGDLTGALGGVEQHIGGSPSAGMAGLAASRAGSSAGSAGGGGAATTIGHARGTSWTGNMPRTAVAGVVHGQEAVVPAGGMRVMPSPGGLMLEGRMSAPVEPGSGSSSGAGGTNIYITGPMSFNGIEDVNQLFDQLERIKGQRAR